jgi:hypothetical protein
MRTTLALAAMLMSSTTPALAQRGGAKIPDGTYKCSIWMGSSYVSMGTIRSVKNSLDTNILRKVGATFTGATPTKDGVTINYTSKSGYRESMDCKRA